MTLFYGFLIRNILLPRVSPFPGYAGVTPGRFNPVCGAGEVGQPSWMVCAAHPDFLVQSDQFFHRSYDKGPVEKAAGQYAVSPTNPAFIKEYRDALQAFIVKHRSDADPDLIQDYEQQLERLGGANGS
jgi:hypothetical protein